MLSFTKKIDYALVSLSYLADRPDQTVSAREVATAYDMPAALVMNILKTLHHADVLESLRGTKGGYRLNSDLSKISVYELITILEGPMHLTECSDPHCMKNSVNCKVRGCPIREPVRALQNRISGFLKEVSLADILLPERKRRLAELVGSRR